MTAGKLCRCGRYRSEHSARDYHPFTAAGVLRWLPAVRRRSALAAGQQS